MLAMMTVRNPYQWRRWKRGPVFPNNEKRKCILLTALEQGPMGALSLLQAAIKKAGVTINSVHTHPTWWYKVLYELEYEGLLDCRPVRPIPYRGQRSVYSLTRKGREEALRFRAFSPK